MPPLSSQNIDRVLIPSSRDARHCGLLAGCVELLVDGAYANGYATVVDNLSRSDFYHGLAAQQPQ